jgi:hypothetical protein
MVTAARPAPSHCEIKGTKMWSDADADQDGHARVEAIRYCDCNGAFNHR